MEKGKIKTKLYLHDTVLFRIPQFPLNAKLEDCWEALKASIADASPDFYEMIRDLQPSDIPNQSSGVQITIGKYFNRARFRATPYGSFAGFGVCGLTQNDQEPIVINEKPISHHFRNWPEIADLNDFWKNKPDHDILVFANSSYYRIGDQIRYLYKEGREFELSDVGYEPVIERILELCSVPLKLTLLIAELIPLCLDTNSIKPLIFDLIDAKLLITNFHPNIIGKDYFQRLKIPVNLSSTVYTITEYHKLSGALNEYLLKDFQELINFLHHWAPTQKNTVDLDNFITGFRKKYDQRRIPIMQALDPEIGIGFGFLESQKGLSNLIKDIQENKSKSAINQDTNLRELLAPIMLKGNGSKVICLEDETIDLKKQKMPLPNGINMLFSITDQGILLEQLGGSSANTLLGRFSIVNDQVLDNCRKLAEIEQQANPDVLFFDIAHVGDINVDNVNRRAQIYDFQLSILNYDCSKQPISIDDIDLTVMGDQLYLISRKHNKRLIPRLTTAYNYVRSDLSLFRLLCDVQMQGIQTRFLFDPEQAIPGQLFYPRIQYKNIIISTAKWKLEYREEFQNLQNFLNYVKEINLPFHIKVGHADQTLILDLQDDSDIRMLISILKAKQTLLVNEGFTSSNFQVKNQRGEDFNSEFLLSFYHTQCIYQTIPFEKRNKNTIQRFFLPGSEWLYFEFYVHFLQTDDLLLNEIATLLNNQQKSITEWFFIRYNENGDHIRLRLRIPDSSQLSVVIKATEGLMQVKMDCGLIADIRVCRYEREIEKYSAQLYPIIETHFHIDSCYAFSCIGNHLEETMIYHLTLMLMLETGEAIFRNASDFQQLISKFCEAHNREHEMNTKLFKMLNSNYNEFNKQGHIIPEFLIQYFKSLRQSFVNMLTITDDKRKPDLFANLFHMHINRLFASDQRIHETIIYNYLVKQIKTAQHHHKELV
ncbi:thiopeptide-type bacteriocin biosynthesis protein [Pedobacter sp. ASV1-7]|uniref:thiopeptide-type bacteriocin biosynthesis protein n=1 Tax=Pedobacter sp. ASV1-7 TaxID=3145237 RepID=UPI0032E87D40